VLLCVLTLSLLPHYFRGREQLPSSHCKLDVDSDTNCGDYGQRWHFNKTLCACLPFWYGGCDANANRFITENECFETCGTSSKVPQPSTEHHVEGGCENYTLKWYFDTIQSECSRFWYGGCGGNGNRFETQEACEGLCLRRNSTHLDYSFFSALSELEAKAFRYTRINIC
uniref:BPTI/Kunitz inhibitor domain-containing protein n=1 Tax=Oncorhynchus tshawytscha TaxID=74940 RepID=A0AAZ3SD75_ONCTS